MERLRLEAELARADQLESERLEREREARAHEREKELRSLDAHYTGQEAEREAAQEYRQRRDAAERDAHDIRGWALAPGDAVAFDFGTLHGAPANASGARRRAISVRWVGDGARFGCRISYAYQDPDRKGQGGSAGLAEALDAAYEADPFGPQAPRDIALTAGSNPVTFDEGCVAAVRDAAEALGYGHMDIISGAGHDACWINRVAPTAMIMCPCVGGLSHNEAEEISRDWAQAGTDVLLHAVLTKAEVVA